MCQEGAKYRSLDVGARPAPFFSPGEFPDRIGVPERVIEVLHPEEEEVILVSK